MVLIGATLKCATLPPFQNICRFFSATLINRLIFFLEYAGELCIIILR
jgi:hypothetical protein